MARNAFRLLTATIEIFYAKKKGLHTWVRPRDSAEASRRIQIEFSGRPDGRTNKNWFTIIIGRNGIGKSRILSDISELFAIQTGDLNPVAGRYDRTKVTYYANGDVRTCQTDRDNRDKIENVSSDLPSKIITSTVTPFDKFRLSRRVGRERIRSIGTINDDHLKERYAYIGLRDANGRTNTQFMVFRSLEALIEKSSQGDRAKADLEEILHVLGYDSIFRVWYRTRLDSSLKKLLELLRSQTGQNEDEQFLKHLSSRSAELLSKQPEGLHTLRRSLEVLRDLDPNNTSFSAEVDILVGKGNKEVIGSLTFLRKLQLISIDRIEIKKSGETNFLNLLEASSGEISIVANFLGIASAIEDNSLIFIDEPEISLHPEWQSKYMTLLKSAFAMYKGCHFIVATHSPLILSDIDRESSSVVFLGNEENTSESADNFAGESVDALLMEAFNTPGNSNRYLRDKMVTALKLAARGATDSLEFKESLNVLIASKAQLPDDSPLIALIDEFDELLDQR